MHAAARRFTRLARQITYLLVWPTTPRIDSPAQREQQHGVRSEAGSTVMCSSRCWRSESPLGGLDSVIWRHMVLTVARHPITRIAVGCMRMNPCAFIRPKPTRLLSTDRIAQRLDGFRSLERCQERRSPPRRR
jgi:hypothetical protein